MHHELYAGGLLGSISLFVINVPFATYAVINIIRFIHASRWLISGGLSRDERGLRWIDLRAEGRGGSGGAPPDGEVMPVLPPIGSRMLLQL